MSRIEKAQTQAQQLAGCLYRADTQYRDIQRQQLEQARKLVASISKTIETILSK